MSANDLHILMLEDEPLDAELNIAQLSMLEEYNCIVDLVEDRASYINALENSSPDIIISDYNLPQYTGLEALRDLKSRNLLIPFIFVTGSLSEEIAAGAMQAGAWDYVVKDRLFRLPLAVRSTLKLKEEKILAAAAEEKVNRLITAIEQTSAQIIVSDKTGTILYVNKKFTEMTGLDSDAVIGKDAMSIQAIKDDIEKMSVTVDKLINGEVYRGEVMNKKKDDTLVWESVSITPIVNSENNVTSFVAVKEDITPRKQMEGQIIEARDKAEKSDRLKDAFLQNLSHEIRTPLNAIVGFSDLLNRSNTVTADVIKEYTGIINESSHQLLSIVTDILTIASIQTGQEKLNIKPVDINKLFSQLKEMFCPLAEARNLNISFPPLNSTKNNTLFTDEKKLTQILSNLINNAIKFTHDGSVSVKCQVINNIIEFHVIDTGIGIEKEAQNVIFDRFRQADDTIHIQYGGTGLGLSISKSYAQMLGGDITVESEPEKGSKFVLSLPFSNEITSDISTTTNVFLADDNNVTIMIAEDEINNFILLKTYLKSPNTTILYAENGYEALKLCESNPDIDLVLMDIKMPIMDGVTAFEKIRAIRTNLPIIAQTAYSLKEEKRQFAEVGFDGYIEKPINKEELLSLIKNCINKKGIPSVRK